MSKSGGDGEHSPPGKYLALLSLSALGVVYGDIGTSPLYAVRECFSGAHGIEVTELNVLGVLSLIIWSLIAIISLKYLIIVMRADNDGEGGILALMQLIKPDKGKLGFFIITFALFGAALLYGDGVITPAISVLSAVEGLNVATHIFEPYIIPITLVIIFGLFYMQKRGTSKVGKIFGPVTLIWFIVIAALGLASAIKSPIVFTAFNPWYAVKFFLVNQFHGLIVLGSVFLVTTGGEAIYADMGHFGKRPIRYAWFTVALPCLLMSYFGQCAILLRDPSAATHPFFKLSPDWFLYPMVILATAATAIASQAVISGAYSLTFQAMHLGYLPRMKVVHTSEEERGQIYIPQINWAMFVIVVVLVLTFKSSSNLTSAYGIAVVSTMVITSTLLFFMMRKFWKWSLPAALAVCIFFLMIELAFFTSNILKVLQGGWMPLLLASVIFLLMTTWFKGRKIVRDQIRKQTSSLENYIKEFLSIRQNSISGTAVYMSRDPVSIPPALIHNIKHHKILHKQVITLSIIFEKVPHIAVADRLEVSEDVDGFRRVVARYGFMDSTNMQQIIQLMNDRGLNIKVSNTTFFLGSETLVLRSKPPLMSRWREKIFLLMNRNAQRATEFFNIPADRVFEIGSQVEI